MDVSIVGANGDIGREIAAVLVENQIVTRLDRLQLVGRPGGRSETALHGLRADLWDAHAERLPQIDVAMGPEEVLADIVIFAAGETMSTDPHEVRSRDSLAETNRPVFEAYAEALARHGHGQELVIAVTNPVEVAVEVFARTLGRHRVIGMGAYLDTMRFRREIAADLGIRRSRVRGLVVGEHGTNAIPLWSSVGAFGFSQKEVLKRLRRPAPPPRQVLGECLERLRAGDARGAYARCDEFPADVRLYVKPFLTHLTGAKTPIGTAEIVARLLREILSGTEFLASVQARVEGEFFGVTGVLGVPAVLSSAGIVRIHEPDLWPEEIRRIRELYS